MSKFADQLLADLMREHGEALSHITLPSRRRHKVAARRALLAGGGTVAVAGVIAGSLAAGSGTPAAGVGGAPVARPARSGHPAYAVTRNPGGTITLTVYRKSGIAAANARLSQLFGQQIVVVPVEPGCPPLPLPNVLAGVVPAAEGTVSNRISVTVNPQAIPAEDILVIGVRTTTDRQVAVGLSSPPAPSCFSLPPAAGNGGSGS